MTEKLRGVANIMLAGMSISLGCYIYCVVGGPLGALLFTVGLSAVCTFGFKLYTGQIKNTDSWEWIPRLAYILLFNAVGCILCSLMASGNPEVVEKCLAIVAKRSEAGFLPCLGTGIGCGFLMTLAVVTWKTHPLVLFVSIPAFILAGLTHSVADAFYYAVGYEAIDTSAMLGWVGTALGNFVGGLLFKLGYTTMPGMPAAK